MSLKLMLSRSSSAKFNCSILEYHRRYVEPIIIIVAVTIILATFSIFGNIFVVILAVKYTVRKNLHHLIINMAVADLLLAISVQLW